MGYSLRDEIEDLKKHGELIEINDEVDWNLEISALGILLGRTEGKAPALLFNKVKGYPKGYRLVTGMATGPARAPHRRGAIGFGIDPNLNSEQYAREFNNRFSRPLKPIEVSTGPCKEVKKMGKDVNLFDFPFPYYSVGDGARYSMVSEAIIGKDPDSDWVNWAMYSTSINSKNRVTFSCHTGAHLAVIFVTKYEARNQSMPIAVAIGVDPAVARSAGYGAPPGMSEVDYAGALRGAPIELVRCETSDLLVPADAEIILEGELRPHERLPEGPKMEMWCFQAGPRRPTYTARINCVTHRKDPILVCAPLEKTAAQGAGGTMGAGWREVEKSTGGISWAHEGYSSISVRKIYPSVLRDLTERFWATTMGSHHEHIQLVDDDVDCKDMEQVAEASFTQVNPKRDFKISDNVEPKVLVACPAADEIDWQRNTYEVSFETAKQTVDCTTKAPGMVRRTGFEYLFPEHLQQWVVDNWKKLGFEGEPRWNLPYIKQP